MPPSKKPPSKKPPADLSVYTICIDMSYFIFYRYYALTAWWKLAKPDDILGNPIDNPEFVEKFKKTFIDKINEIPKRLKIKNYTIIAGKDCPRLDIWRHSLYDKYKENRVYDDTFLGGPFFKLSYQILSELNIKVLYHPHLEGDDCVAITVKRLLASSDEMNVVIVANDMDYLQLAGPRVKLLNLKYKLLTDSKKWSGDPQKDLFCKIVMGDKSDDIAAIFKKCGPKTTLKYYDDKEAFEAQLKKENAYDVYERNKKLVDFNNIPDELISEFTKLNC